MDVSALVESSDVDCIHKSKVFNLEFNKFNRSSTITKQLQKTLFSWFSFIIDNVHATLFYQKSQAGRRVDEEEHTRRLG
jgi:hypothetical protein